MENHFSLRVWNSSFELGVGLQIRDPIEGSWCFFSPTGLNTSQELPLFSECLVQEYLDLLASQVISVGSTSSRLVL